MCEKTSVFVSPKPDEYDNIHNKHFCEKNGDHIKIQNIMAHFTIGANYINFK